MNNEKKGIAIIGYGGMGKWHADKILAGGVLELKGIWDIKESRRELARSLNIHTYSSLEELLADKTVEIVTIAVPNELHAPLAISAMEAGKNVISEKPVCLSSAELQAVYDVSERTGKLFTVHQNRRWDAYFRVMQEVYNSGDLGEVFTVESRVQGSRGIPGDWRGKPEHGGGMVLDWGVHMIDQMLQITGDRRIERIYCCLDHVTNYQVDDGFKLDIYFEGGLTGRIEVGTSHFISLPLYYMAGNNGTAMINSWESECQVVCCKSRDEKDVIPVVTAAGLTKTMAPRTKESITEYSIEQAKLDVHDFYRNFVLAIDGKADMIIKHCEVMRVMKVMEACFASDKAKAPVAFEDTI